MHIKTADKKDLSKIKELVYQSFLTEPHSDHMEQELVERIWNSSGFVPELSIIAMQEDEIIGYALFSEITLKTKEQAITVLGLAPLSVSVQAQKKGIGSALMHEGHKRATKLGYPLVILLGHPNYYPRFGYEPAQKYNISFQFEAPAECCMVKFLNKTELPDHSTVVYPDTF